MTLKEHLTLLAHVLRRYDYEALQKSTKMRGSMMPNLFKAELEMVDKVIDGSIVYLTSYADVIPDGKFQAYASLQKAYFPEVTSIGANAFRDCTALTKVEFPKVLTVNAYAFQNCTSLSGMVSMPLATAIGNYAFRGCTSLVNVRLYSATEINTYAFSGCTNLDTLIVGTRNGNTLCRLGNVNSLANTKIANGSGRILVPGHMVDSYKAASGWSTYANMIYAY